jgi:hypothetical protein
VGPTARENLGYDVLRGVRGGVMRSSGSIDEPFRALVSYPDDPLVRGLATDAEAFGQFAHGEQSRSIGNDELHAFIHG